MAEIIEPDISAAATPAIIVEKHRLVAGHVGAQPGQKNDPRRRSRDPAVSQRRAVRAGQKFGRVH
jgi:hypothetical protein